jgi:hypothetical protein
MPERVAHDAVWPEHQHAVLAAPDGALGLQERRDAGRVERRHRLQVDEKPGLAIHVLAEELPDPPGGPGRERTVQAEPPESLERLRLRSCHRGHGGSVPY